MARTAQPIYCLFEIVLRNESMFFFTSIAAARLCVGERYVRAGKGKFMQRNSM